MKKTNVYLLKETGRHRAYGSKVEIPSPEELRIEEEITPIQGHDPGSKEEWRFAKALDYLGVYYVYQYAIWDYPFYGSQKIDFLVFTPVLPTPVFIQGTYWHTGKYAEQTKYNLQKVADAFRGQFYDPIEIWDYEIPTVDHAISVAKQRLKL